MKHNTTQHKEHNTMFGTLSLKLDFYLKEGSRVCTLCTVYQVRLRVLAPVSLSINEFCHGKLANDAIRL